MLAGGGLVSAGWLIGRLLPAQKQKATESCCEHPFGQHDPKTGKCNAQVQRRKYVGGAHVGYEWVPCPCLQHTGPRPLDSYYAPEIMGD